MFSSCVQAGLSNTVDKEQEDYRSYLLQRLVPAMAAYYDDSHDSRSGRVPAADMLTPHDVMERITMLTTRQLERRLAHFYEDQVCLAAVLGTSICDK